MKLSNYSDVPTAIPDDMQEYYRPATIKILADEGYIELSEAEDFLDAEVEACESQDMKFLGFAIPQSRYRAILDASDYAVVDIVNHDDITELMIHAIDGGFYSVEPILLGLLEDM